MLALGTRPIWRRTQRVGDPCRVRSLGACSCLDIPLLCESIAEIEKQGYASLQYFDELEDINNQNDTRLDVDDVYSLYVEISRRYHTLTYDYAKCSVDSFFWIDLCPLNMIAQCARVPGYLYICPYLRKLVAVPHYMTWSVHTAKLYAFVHLYKLSNLELQRLLASMEKQLPSDFSIPESS